MNLEELLKLCDAAESNWWHGSPESKAFIDSLNPDTAKKLIQALIVARETLGSVASFDYAEHDSVSYWRKLDHEKVAIVAAKDTEICREALAEIEELLK